MPAVLPSKICIELDNVLVPATAWRALQAQVNEVQAQQLEMQRYIRHALKAEYARRQHACTHIQAHTRGMKVRHMEGVASFLRRKSARRHWLLLNTCELHVSGSTSSAITGTPALHHIQARARGFIVRSRVATWRRQQRAATVLEAVIRGRTVRLVTAPKLERHRLSMRVVNLEKQLQQEIRMREDLEAAVRKLWQDVYEVKGRKQERQSSETNQ